MTSSVSSSFPPSSPNPLLDEQSALLQLNPNIIKSYISDLSVTKSESSKSSPPLGKVSSGKVEPQQHQDMNVNSLSRKKKKKTLKPSSSVIELKIEFEEPVFEPKKKDLVQEEHLEESVAEEELTEDKSQTADEISFDPESSHPSHAEQVFSAYMRHVAQLDTFTKYFNPENRKVSQANQGTPDEHKKNPGPFSSCLESLILREIDMARKYAVELEKSLSREGIVIFDEFLQHTALIVDLLLVEIRAFLTLMARTPPKKKKKKAKGNPAVHIKPGSLIDLVSRKEMTSVMFFGLDRFECDVANLTPDDWQFVMKSLRDFKTCLTDFRRSETSVWLSMEDDERLRHAENIGSHISKPIPKAVTNTVQEKKEPRFSLADSEVGRRLLDNSGAKYSALTQEYLLAAASAGEDGLLDGLDLDSPLPDDFSCSFSLNEGHSDGKDLIEEYLEDLMDETGFLKTFLNTSDGSDSKGYEEKAKQRFREELLESLLKSQVQSEQPASIPDVERLLQRTKSEILEKERRWQDLEKRNAQWKKTIKKMLYDN